MEAFWRQIISGRDKRPIARLVRESLGLAAWPYGRAMAIRNRLYDAGLVRCHRVSVPVISIGNLTLGGTGKTPFVEFVCRSLLKRVKRPVILSRGYGSAGTHNDESLLLQANLPDVPHLQGKDRVAIARQAIEQFHPDVLVLDDGFQHRRLARDLDIVLIDCTEPFGYGRLFPRGLLREPLGSLRRAGLIVLSRADQCSPADRHRIREAIVWEAEEKPTVEAEHRPKELLSSDGRSLPLGELAGRSVAAFCGIGNPAGFWNTLRGLGGRLVGTRTFRDHHPYSPSDIEDLQNWVGEIRPDFVVTTQKDMVKIPAAAWQCPPLVAMQIEAVISDPDGHLDRAVAGVFGEPPLMTQAA